MPIESEAEEMWREEVAWRLRAVFVIKGLRNSEAAKMLGVSDARLTNWLGAIAVPTPYYLHLISKRFGVSVDYLLNDDIQSLREDLRTPLLRGAKAAIKQRKPELLNASPRPEA